MGYLVSNFHMRPGNPKLKKEAAIPGIGCQRSTKTHIFLVDGDDGGDVDGPLAALVMAVAVETSALCMRD